MMAVTDIRLELHVRIRVSIGRRLARLRLFAMAWTCPHRLHRRMMLAAVAGPNLLGVFSCFALDAW